MADTGFHQGGFCYKIAHFRNFEKPHPLSLNHAHFSKIVLVLPAIQAVFNCKSAYAVGFCLFNKQEGCSTKGRFSQALRATLVDRMRKPGGYVDLPRPGQIQAAEVFDGGLQYCDVNVSQSNSLSGSPCNVHVVISIMFVMSVMVVMPCSTHSIIFQ